MVRGRARFAGFVPHLVYFYASVSIVLCADYGIPIEIKLWDTGRTPLVHMVDVTNEFGLKVLAEHNFLNDNNIAFSPYGLMGILVALYEGVDGESSYQIQRGMQLPWNRNVMRIGFRDIHRTLKTYFVPEEGFLAGLALNNENVTFNESYKKILRFYGFDLENEKIPTPGSNSNDTVITTTTTEQSLTTMAADNKPTTITTERITERDDAYTTPTKEETTINPDVETITDIDPRDKTSALTTSFAASNAEFTTSLISEMTTFRSTAFEESSSRKTTVQTMSTAEMISSTLPSSTEIPATMMVTESTTETTSTETSNTPTSTEIPSEITITASTTESTSTETSTIPTSSEIPSTVTITESTTESTSTVTSPTSTVTTTGIDNSDPLTEMTSISVSDQTTTELIDSFTTMTTMLMTQSVGTASTDSDTSETAPSMSTTDSMLTDSTTTSTLETLERRKRSKANCLLPKAPIMDDHLLYRSFDIPPETVIAQASTDKMFLANGLRSVQVTYMQYDTVLEHAYLPHLEASALRLPLDSDRYYLLVVLPLQGGAAELGRLLARMARESDLSDVHAALRPRRVRAIVPSFIVKGHVTLTTDLQKLGIRDVFEPRQHDFTPMTRQPGVYVRSIEQAVSVAIRKYQPDDHKKNRYVTNRRRVYFSATYPFLYFVMDSNIHVALMAGKMVDPLNTRIL